MSESAPALPVSALAEMGAAWLLDGEYRQHSPRTLDERRDFPAKLAWLMERDGLAELTPTACRTFLRHVAVGHLEPAGRWASGQRGPVKPNTVHSYYRRLRTFACWLARNDLVAVNPRARIEPPRVPRVLIEPFTDAQIEALLAAAAKGTHPLRDRALLLFLLDTGARVSELCSLRRADFDFLTRRCVVRGKGGHERALHLGTVSARALWAYVNEARQAPEAALFLGDRGTRAGEGLRRKGVQELFWRLEKAAGLSGVRCSPHTCRHSYAIRFLRAGGGQFELMAALGHSDVTQTSAYVKLAAIDLGAAQKSFSPMDRLRRGM